MSGRIALGLATCSVLLSLAALVGCGGGASPVGNGPGLGNGANNALLHGQYAFSFSGQGTGGASFAAAGSFTADGNGHLSGIEDVNGHNGAVNFSGPYSVGADGRGNAVLGIQPGCPNWQFTMVSHSHGLLVCLNTNITASGTIVLQDPSAFSSTKLKGNYVFGLSGLGVSGGLVVTAGDFTLDGSGSVTRGEMDLNDVGTVSQDIAVSGTYSVAANGRGTATLNSSYATQAFVFYVVNATDLKMVEVDSQPMVSGEVLSQSAAPFSLASLSGSHVFTLGGSDGSNNPLVLGGVFSTDGAGKISSGLLDSNDGGVTSLGNPLTGTYSVSSTGRGLLTLSVGSLQFALYPASNGALELVDVDGTVAIAGTGQAQTGAPFGPSSISGNYAANFSGTNLTSFGEEDITGQLIGDGVGNFTGVLDINNAGSIFQGVGLGSSTYSMNSDGRGFATLNASTGTFAMQIYQIDRNTALFLDVDNARVLAGIMQKQQF